MKVPQDEEIIARVAALDIAKTKGVCCVRVPGSGPGMRRSEGGPDLLNLTKSPASVMGPAEPGADSGGGCNRAADCRSDGGYLECSHELGWRLPSEGLAWSRVDFRGDLSEPFCRVN